MLEYERALQVPGAMQSRGQPEMPLEQGANLTKTVEHGIGSD
jgi:hypothetical protein